MLILPLSPGFFMAGVAPATKVLMWTNLLAFVVFNLLLPAEYLEMFALTPDTLWSWRGITYAFLHGDAVHLFGNMVFFIPFSVIVEDKLGFVRTLGLYLLSAFMAGAGWAWMNDGFFTLVGASGAVAAMMGASMVLRPHVKVPGVWLLFIFPVLFFATPAWLWATFYFLADNWKYLASLVTGEMASIAFEAHIAGFVFSFVACWVAIRLGWVRGASSDLVNTLRRAAAGSGPRSRPQSFEWDLPTVLPEAFRRLEAGEELPAEGLVALAQLAGRSGRALEAYRLLQLWIESREGDPASGLVAAELGFLCLKDLARPDLAKLWFEDAVRRGVTAETLSRIESALRIL